MWKEITQIDQRTKLRHSCTWSQKSHTTKLTSAYVFVHVCIAYAVSIKHKHYTF